MNIPKHKLQGTKSVFVRFRSGFTLFVKPNIKKCLTILVGQLGKNPDHRAVFKKLIKRFSDNAGSGIHPTSTWYCAVKEIVDRYEELGEFGEETKKVFLKLLALIAAENEDGLDWDKIKRFILRHIAPLSGWERVKRQRESFLKGIPPDSNAMIILPGSAKTIFVEDGEIVNDDFFDHVYADATSPWGKLGMILRLIALVDIAEQYKKYKKHFNKRICCSLPDQDYSSAYLHWRWYLLASRDLRPAFWNPRSCYSDSQWLAYDLLADVTKAQNGNQFLALEPTVDNVRKFEEAFKGYPHQFEIALDTYLHLGNEREIYFDFMDRKVRWINSTPFECALLTVPSKDNTGADGLKIGRRFLSLLVEKTGYPITEISTGMRGQKMYIPVILQPKSTGGLGLPADIFRGENPDNFTEKKWLAMALFKDGINSRSVYYSFLSLYKILELGCKGKRGKLANNVKTWVKAHLSDATKRYPSWQTESLKSGEQAEEYLYHSCRSAIAHIKADKYPVSIDPDDPQEYSRIRRDLDIIKELAKIMIQEIP
jgi:hypothetical protein